MDNKFSNIKERILYLIELKGDTKEKFFNKIGMTYGSFKGDAKKRPINSNALANILTIYPDVNPMWLIVGNGETFHSEPNIKPPEDEKHDNLKELKMIRELAEELGRIKKELEDLKAINKTKIAPDNIAAEPELTQKYTKNTHKTQ